MITQKLDLNLIPGRVLPRVNVSQYDKGTRTLEFTIYNGEILFNPTGYTAYIQGQKPDGHGFNYAATIENQKISMEVVEQMTAVAGSVACEIVIKDGTDQIGTGNFILQVEAAALPDDATMSESDYNIIQKAVEDAQAAAEEVKEASANAPYIGQNGNWYVYDAESKQFVDTGIEAEGPEGPAGPTGNGISSITKTGTVGLVDTYTITFTDGTTTTFTVTNGEDAVTTVEQDDSLALAPTSAGNALPLAIYGQSTQNGTPTPSAPVAIESASADFKCVGKNLLPNNASSLTTHGVTFTPQSDGSVIANGTQDGASGGSYYHITDTFEGDGEYIINGCPSDGSSSTYRLYMFDNTSRSEVASDVGNGATATLVSGHLYTINIMIGVSQTVSNITFKPMLRLATVADATYEPYKHTDITTYLTLRAIEVTSSDPYNLVKDGHYYIADTIDWDEVDGYQITRRVGNITFDGSEDEAWRKAANAVYNTFTLDSDYNNMIGVRGGLSNRFKYSNTISGVGLLWVHSTLLKPYFTHSLYGTMTAAEFKTWLTNNPTTLAYVLPKPTTESVSSAQAKALLSMCTYDESTSIDALNSPAPVLELEYAKTRTPALALTGHNMAHINAIDIGDM